MIGPPIPEPGGVQGHWEHWRSVVGCALGTWGVPLRLNLGHQQFTHWPKMGVVAGGGQKHSRGNSLPFFLSTVTLTLTLSTRPCQHPSPVLCL